jgi:hypothetical protein
VEHVHGGRVRGTVCKELMVLCGGELTVVVLMLAVLRRDVCGFLIL